MAAFSFLNMKRLRLAASSATMVMLPLTAFAADLSEHEHEGGGMPQLDFTTAPTQIFWTIVAFIALYWLLSRKALPRVAETLELRHGRISADLDQAAKLRVEAEGALQRYEAMLAETRARAAEALEKTRSDVQAGLARRQAELDAELGRKVETAEAEIGQARDKAVAALTSVAADAARIAVRRLTGIEVGQPEAAEVAQRVAKAGA